MDDQKDKCCKCGREFNLGEGRYLLGDGAVCMECINIKKEKGADEACDSVAVTQ